MSQKWVDNEVYFGPDRRKRDAGKRWSDRRSYNDAGEPPPLGALLRRLRIRLSGVPNANERHHAMQLINLAINAAERRNLRSCSDVLRQVARAVAAGDIAQAEPLITEAMALAGSALTES